MKPVYLDYAATTPVDPRVAEKMSAYLCADGVFANPTSRHVLGHVAKQAVENAREQVAALIQAEPSEIIWTSGATEANNLAIKGAAELYQRKGRRKGRHLITLQTEHKAVLDPCQQLEKQGFLVSYLKPDARGLLNLDAFQSALRDDTVLVSIMLVNNELGVLQDLQAIAEITAARGILLHVDAAQGAGKVAIDVNKLPVDLLSLCAHKVYGPKGIGALYLRRKPRVRVAPQIQGGGQEQGLRAGTLPTHQIVGMGEAFCLAQQEMAEDFKKIEACRQHFLQNLESLPYVLHGDLKHAVPHILNVRFADISADALMRLMPDLILSRASACLQAGTSHVLRAIGLSDSQAKAALRFSFGRFTTMTDIDVAVQTLRQAVSKLA